MDLPIFKILKIKNKGGDKKNCRIIGLVKNILYLMAKDICSIKNAVLMKKRLQ